MLSSCPSVPNDEREKSQPMVNGGVNHIIKADHSEDLSAVPETQLLDTSANKAKGQLGSSGALSSRRPPTKRAGSIVSRDLMRNEHSFQ